MGDCFSALLMEYEQRELLDEEIAFLQKLEDARNTYGAHIFFPAATEVCVAMRLSQANEIELPGFGTRNGVNDGPSNVTLAGCYTCRHLTSTHEAGNTATIRPMA